MTDGKVYGLINAWEQFKRINDERLKEIDRKGDADPLYLDHLKSISETIDNHKARIDQSSQSPDVPSSEQRSTVPSGSYAIAFRRYLRRGMDAELAALESKALSAGSDPDGGYHVTPTMSSTIASLLLEASPMRRIAAIETITSDALELIDDREQAQAGWTVETAAPNETVPPTLAKRSIPAHELYAQPKATQRLVEDSAIDIESWLSSKIADIFVRKESEAFISGSGVGMPRGLLTYPAGKDSGRIEQVNSGLNGTVTADGLINLFYSLPGRYSRCASFLMNRTVVQSVRLLKQSSTNEYLWQPGLSAGSPDTLLGVPVHTAPEMPAAALHTLAVALGDFKRAYQIVDRQGIRILRDPFTEKPFVKFYATKRVGGDVVDSSAIKLLKLAA